MDGLDGWMDGWWLVGYPWLGRRRSWHITQRRQSEKPSSSSWALFTCRGRVVCRRRRR